MPSHKALLVRARRTAAAAGTAFALSTLPVSAQADAVFDGVLDFAPTHVGARIPELDIKHAVTIYNREAFDLFLAEDQSPAAVPEPGTWALMIGGFGLAGAALRRRRASALA